VTTEVEFILQVIAIAMSAAHGMQIAVAIEEL
jgi:hypothetical protein